MLGKLVCVSVSVEALVGEAEAGSGSGSELASAQLHSLMYSVDMRQHVALMSHTWMPSPSDPGPGRIDGVSDFGSTGASVEGEPTSSASASASALADTPEVPLRVMTFNLWHNNPAAWVFGHEDRQRR